MWKCENKSYASKFLSLLNGTRCYKHKGSNITATESIASQWGHVVASSHTASSVPGTQVGVADASFYWPAHGHGMHTKLLLGFHDIVTLSKKELTYYPHICGACMPLESDFLSNQISMGVIRANRMPVMFGMFSRKLRPGEPMQEIELHWYSRINHHFQVGI